jgi:hypothetical protein
MNIVENLPHVRLHLIKVGKHVLHDLSPLFIVQLLNCGSTCRALLASEKAKTRFIFSNIVTRGCIMHARKVLIVVLFSEV